MMQICLQKKKNWRNALSELTPTAYLLFGLCGCLPLGSLHGVCPVCLFAPPLGGGWGVRATFKGGRSEGLHHCTIHPDTRKNRVVEWLIDRFFLSLFATFNELT